MGIYRLFRSLKLIQPSQSNRFAFCLTADNVHQAAFFSRQCGLRRGHSGHVIEDSFSTVSDHVRRASTGIFFHFSFPQIPITSSCMDDVRCLMEGSFQLPQRGEIHANRKFEFCNCSRLPYRLANGGAILFYQALTARVINSADTSGLVPFFSWCAMLFSERLITRGPAVLR